MSAVPFEPRPLESNEGEIQPRHKSAGAILIELGVALASAESRAPIPGLCSRCLSHRDPRNSRVKYPNIFCSERCEQEFVRTALASLTLDDCVRMHARLEALLTGAREPSL